MAYRIEFPEDAVHTVTMDLQGHNAIVTGTQTRVYSWDELGFT